MITINDLNELRKLSGLSPLKESVGSEMVSMINTALVKYNQLFDISDSNQLSKFDRLIDIMNESIDELLESPIPNDVSTYYFQIKDYLNKVKSNIQNSLSNKSHDMISDDPDESDYGILKGKNLEHTALNRELRDLNSKIGNILKNLSEITKISNGINQLNKDYNHLANGLFCTGNIGTAICPRIQPTGEIEETMGNTISKPMEYEPNIYKIKGKADLPNRITNNQGDNPMVTPRLREFVEIIENGVINVDTNKLYQVMYKKDGITINESMTGINLKSLKNQPNVIILSYGER